MRFRAMVLAGALSVWFGVGSAAAKVEILVEKASQRMVVIQDGYMRYIWPVSTGRDELETPNGSYTPQRLERSWFSHEYYNSPMPNAIFFHGGYAIHGSYAINQLGGPASHGCVRLHPHHAALLFELVSQEGPQNTTIEVTDDPRPDLLPQRDNLQPRQISAVAPRPERPDEFGDMADLGPGPRASRGVAMVRPPLPLRDNFQPREMSSGGPRLERLGDYGDMAELSPGPRASRAAMARAPLPPPRLPYDPPRVSIDPPRYSSEPPRAPPDRRRLTNLIAAVNSPRGPCVIRADSPDCRPTPASKPVDRALRERAEAAQASPPAPPATSEKVPAVYGFKVLPGSCWSGGASRWRWWQSSGKDGCK